MSVHVIKKVWKVSGITPVQKLVLVALADHANDAGHCWPHMETLAKETGLHVRTVERAIGDLEIDAHLSRVRKGRRGYHYQIHPGWLNEALPGTEPGQDPGAKPGRNNSLSRQTTGSDSAHERASSGPVPPRIEPSRNHKRTMFGRSNIGTLITKGWKPTAFVEGSQSARIYAAWSYSERDMALEHFLAHHVSKGTRSLDWQEAWSGWVLNRGRWQPEKRYDQKPLYQLINERKNP